MLVPVPVFFFLGVAVLTGLFLRSTSTGRHLYALGGNEEATRLSGVSPFYLKAVAYGLCSTLAGLAGILYAAYNRQGDPSSGQGYELNAIAAAVGGGCSLTGGVGSISGPVLGASLLSLIINGINLTVKRNASLWENVIVGSVVLAAVTFNVLRQRRSSKRK